MTKPTVAHTVLVSDETGRIIKQGPVMPVSAYEARVGMWIIPASAMSFQTAAERARRQKAVDKVERALPLWWHMLRAKMLYDDSLTAYMVTEYLLRPALDAARLAVGQRVYSRHEMTRWTLRARWDAMPEEAQELALLIVPDMAEIARAE
jgi:hypothetical protein